jgi:hypothetical protein
MNGQALRAMAAARMADGGWQMADGGWQKLGAVREVRGARCEFRIVHSHFEPSLVSPPSAIRHLPSAQPPSAIRHLPSAHPLSAISAAAIARSALPAR